MGKKKEDNKQNLIKKYERIRSTVVEICEEYNFDYADYLQRFPTDDYEKLTGCQISHRISELNDDLRVVIEGLFLEDWIKIVEENYEHKEQKSVFDMVKTLMSGDPADAHKYLTKSMKLLKMLSNPETKQETLKNLEEYCATHTFEESLNTYSLAKSSKYAKEVDAAMKSGFDKLKVPKRVKEGVKAYCNCSKQKEKEDAEPQPGNN